MFTATLQSNDPKHCLVHIVNVEQKKPLPYGLHLAISPTKLNDRFEWFLEKATEIGITQITPIVCHHSERKVIKPERYQKIILSAGKQSLKYHFPVLHPMCSFKEFLEKYKEHWDKFFEEWSKGESHQKKLLKNDKIWSKHKGTEWETKEGKKRSTKLEPDAFPQPYLGNIDDHSVITLNLNPSRSKKYGYENFKEPVLDSSYKYNQYAESFPTYDTHPFWENQDGWIDSIFKKILVEEKLVEEKLYQYNPETKKEEKKQPSLFDFK